MIRGVRDDSYEENCFVLASLAAFPCDSSLFHVNSIDHTINKWRFKLNNVQLKCFIIFRINVIENYEVINHLS